MRGGVLALILVLVGCTYDWTVVPKGNGDCNCTADEVCTHVDGLCGKGEPGVCKPRPFSCQDSDPLACGCDGSSKASACTLNQSGVDVSKGSCH